MGVWGAGIFQDDDALDVRADYRWYLADIQSDNIATDNIVKGYGATFENLEANTSLWLALALTQWKMGRLDERVKGVSTAHYRRRDRSEEMGRIKAEIQARFGVEAVT